LQPAPQRRAKAEIGTVTADMCRSHDAGVKFRVRTFKKAVQHFETNSQLGVGLTSEEMANMT